MFQLPSLLRYLGAMIFIVVVACCACIYINPYSIHQVFVLPYEAFDTVPDAHGKVTLESGRPVIDFRLPDSTFSQATITELQCLFDGLLASDSTWMTRCVELVRSRLNATDTTMPKAQSADAEHLYRYGLDEYYLCSEHAILLTEVLQLFQRQARVLWLQGHVAAEYLDRDRNKWGFVDPHLNVLFVDSDKTPMSVAEVIYAAERRLPFHPIPICSESEQTHSLGSRDIDWTWYHNILLNGECYALSGSTLRDSSRWTHLVRYRRRPQMLVLSTSYDSSAAEYLEPFRLRKALLLALAIV
ncbi:MAG: hypothetical protein EA424_25945, partial [Planctomycetaceae bacterium]